MMNTRYKRFLTLTMALMSAIVTFAHDVEVDGIFYNLNHKTKEASVTFKGETISKATGLSKDELLNI